MVTLALLAVTVALRAFARKWQPRLTLRLHKIFGVCTLLFGATHATLIWLH